MRFRTLEIILQHANGLHNVNLITKMDVHAVVSISDNNNNTSQYQTIKTPADHKGNADPTWNFPMKFTIDSAALQQTRLTLDIKLVCERTLGDKDVGEVHVPVKELLDSTVNGKKQTVSYQVTNPSGKPKGQITFSYQFQEKAPAAAVSPPNWTEIPSPVVHAPSPAYGGAPSPPPVLYPPAGSYPQVLTDGSGYHAPPVLYPPAGSYPVVLTDGSVYHAPPRYGYQTYPIYGSPAHPGYGYYPPQTDYGYAPQLGYEYNASPNVHQYHHQPPKKV